MHIETNAAVQPTKDNVIRKLDLSLTDDEDVDLVKIMPILTPVALTMSAVENKCMQTLKALTAKIYTKEIPEDDGCH